LALKKAQLDAARAGPTAEERARADARVALAEATVADLQANPDKLRLIAPAGGTAVILVAELAESIPVGRHELTLEVGREGWFALSVSEDALRSLTVDSEVRLSTDDGKQIAARVTELRPNGEFATWRAARAVGDHALNSFRLRLDPTGAVS